MRFERKGNLILIICPPTERYLNLTHTWSVWLLTDRPSGLLQSTMAYILFRDVEEIMDTGGPVIDNRDPAPADLSEQLFINAAQSASSWTDLCLES